MGTFGRGYLNYSNLRYHLLQELPVGSGIIRRRLNGRTGGAALDHDWAVETDGLQFPKYAEEIDLAGAELDHDLVATWIGRPCAEGWVTGLA